MGLKVSQGAVVQKYGDNCEVGEVISFKPDSPPYRIVSIDRRYRRLHLDHGGTTSLGRLLYLHNS